MAHIITPMGFLTYRHPQSAPLAREGEVRPLFTAPVNGNAQGTNMVRNIRFILAAVLMLAAIPAGLLIGSAFGDIRATIYGLAAVMALACAIIPKV